jgi:hypothetical protein
MRPRCFASHGKLNLRNRACTLLLLYVTTVIASPAQTFKSLVSFDNSNGFGPQALVQGTDGSFYGTTYWGGSCHASTQKVAARSSRSPPGGI